MRGDISKEEKKGDFVASRPTVKKQLKEALRPEWELLKEEDKNFIKRGKISKTGLNEGEG